ncbi:MAG TPA: META domain-containing protein [Iamia sp.]|nr:META domain-containing protein [Iamia sp.]
MPDATTTDDELAAQLRAWADDLADQIPSAVAPTSAATGAARPGRRPRLLALAAVSLVAVGLAAVGLWVAAADGPGEDVRAGTTTSTTTSTTAVPDVPLVGTSWWLETIELDGEAQELVPRTPFLNVGPCDPDADCAGGDAITGYDGCNRFGGTVEIGSESLVVGPVEGTQMECGGEMDTLIAEVTRDEVAFDVEGDRLTLRRNAVVATFRAGDGRHPPRLDGATVFTIPGLDPRHRLTWREVEGGAVELRADLFDMNTPEVLTVELGTARGEMAAVAPASRRPSIVFGLVDARATLVTFDRQEGGDPSAPTVALTNRDDVRAFAIVVPGVAGPWDLTATDADGTTVATYEPPPR